MLTSPLLGSHLATVGIRGRAPYRHVRKASAFFSGFATNSTGPTERRWFGCQIVVFRAISDQDFASRRRPPGAALISDKEG
jgi:hypothetical protein